MSEPKTPASKPAASKPPANKKPAAATASKGHTVLSPIRHDGKAYPVGSTITVSASTAKRLRALGAIK